MTDGTTKKPIPKRSGLLSGSAPAVRDLSAAAQRMPPLVFGGGASVANDANAVVAVDPSHAGRNGEGEPTSGSALPSPAAAVPVAQRVAEREVAVIVRIDIALIDDSPYQPRLKYDEGKLAELAETLGHRQIDPLVVRPSPHTPGRYELISGHRRKRAAPLANLQELEAKIIHVTDLEARVLVLAANEPREDFTDFERALGYQGILQAEGGIKSQRQLAREVGVDASLVNKRLAILTLPEDVLEVLREYPNAFSHNYVTRLKALTSAPYDKALLRQTLIRVAGSEIQISALFSIMANGAAEGNGKNKSGRAQSGLSLQRGNRVFAQVTPNRDKREVKVKLPGDCDIDEVATLIHAALEKRYSSEQLTTNASVVGVE